MTGQTIKSEPYSTPDRDRTSSPSLFVYQEDEPLADQRQDAPFWKRCSYLDMFQQIQVKEEAVKDGLRFLKDLELCLAANASQIKSSVKWTDRISK